MTEEEPGYCMGCRGFHLLLTPVPEWGGSACRWCVATRRLDPPEPGPRHICNTSSHRAAGQPAYRRCSCSQWLWSRGTFWYRVDRPPVRWLREHGMDPGEFWGLADEPQGASWLKGFGSDRPPLRVLLSWSFWRWLFSGGS